MDEECVCCGPVGQWGRGAEYSEAKLAQGDLHVEESGERRDNVGLPLEFLQRMCHRDEIVGVTEAVGPVAGRLRVGVRGGVCVGRGRGVGGVLLQCSECNFKEAYPIVWAGEVSLRCASFTVECFVDLNSSCCDAHHVWRAHRTRRPTISGGTSTPNHASSVASRKTESKARRMSQLEVPVSAACFLALMNWSGAVSLPRPGRKPCCTDASTQCRSNARVMLLKIMPVQSLLITSSSISATPG